MNLQERKEALAQKIYGIEDEEILQMLEENIAVYEHNSDITDELSPEQLKDLMDALNEPDEKDTVNEADFKKIFSKWGSK